MENLDFVAIAYEAKFEARDTGQAYLDRHYGGQDHGACGFAWVTIYPKHKGNTKAGKEERKILRAMGFELDWTGKSFQMWNPSGLACQNVDAKHQGAHAAALVFRKYGFAAYAGSRLD